MLSMRQIESVGLEEAPDHLCNGTFRSSELFVSEREKGNDSFEVAVCLCSWKIFPDCVKTVRFFSFSSIL